MVLNPGRTGSNIVSDMPDTDTESKTDEMPDSDNALALVPVVSAEDPQACLDPTAASFVFESKLCPVTYSFHPYTKVANSGNAAIHGLGRPALTLQSTALTQPKVNTGIPRVYQSESRNMFVAEYERFKEVKLNLQGSFPSSMINVVSFDEWVSFRVKITEQRIKQLKSNIIFRTGRATAKRRALEHGPIQSYEADTSRYPKPIIPFPRSIVGGRPPAVTKKSNDIYFENWSRIGKLWGDNIEPMPRTYPYYYGQEAFQKSGTGPPTGANPYSPKILPVGVMHGISTSDFGPNDFRTPGGATSASGTGRTAPPSSKTPEYPGFPGGRHVPVPPFPGIPQPHGGYASNPNFRGPWSGGYHPNPNFSNWNNHNSVPPPSFAGGHHPGNQFGNAFYPPGPVPQARNQSTGAYRHAHYGPNFNLQQPGFAPGGPIPHFVPGSGPNPNFQQPGFPPSAQNANFAQNSGLNPNFPKPGFVPGVQNNSSGQKVGPVPGYVPGSITAPAAASTAAPAPANYVNGSAGSAQSALQQLAITGYAYESDDDYIPEDYEHEGYGEEEGEEVFDGYDASSAYYQNIPDLIPELRLDDPEEEEEKAEDEDKEEEVKPTEVQHEENGPKPE